MFGSLVKQADTPDGEYELDQPTPSWVPGEKDPGGWFLLPVDAILWARRSATACNAGSYPKPDKPCRDRCALSADKTLLTPPPRRPTGTLSAEPGATAGRPGDDIAGDGAFEWIFPHLGQTADEDGVATAAPITVEPPRIGDPPLTN